MDLFMLVFVSSLHIDGLNNNSNEWLEIYTRQKLSDSVLVTHKSIENVAQSIEASNN